MALVGLLLGAVLMAGGVGSDAATHDTVPVERTTLQPCDSIGYDPSNPYDLAGNECRVGDDVTAVRLYKTNSQNPCDGSYYWRRGGRHVEVGRGCRGVFAVSESVEVQIGQPPTVTVRCGGTTGDQPFSCNTGVNDIWQVEMVNDRSGGRCNGAWEWSTAFIDVWNGCEGDFEVTYYSANGLTGDQDWHASDYSIKEVMCWQANTFCETGVTFHDVYVTASIQAEGDPASCDYEPASDRTRIRILDCPPSAFDVYWIPSGPTRSIRSTRSTRAQAPGRSRPASRSPRSDAPAPIRSPGTTSTRTTSSASRRSAVRSSTSSS